MIERAAADSGPLISFEKISNGFTLLRRVVHRIVVPPQVLEEVTAGIPLGSDYIEFFGLHDFVEITPAPQPPSWVDLLHDGERYAISLALAEGVPLLVEDRDARLAAGALGIPLMGALGILLHGHSDGCISPSELNDALLEMYRAGRISQRLLDETLRSRNQ